MYKCYNVKKFFRLILIDAIIFTIIYCFIGIGKNLIFSSADYNSDYDYKKEKIFMPVIMYHSIHNNANASYEVTPEQIESDLRYLKNNNYNSVSAQQLVDYVYNRGELPENPVMITLDDGFYNNLYYLEPLLEKYDMTAVVSIVGTYTENDAVADPHVPEYSYLTWEDINTMLESGRFEIGNHTFDMHNSSGTRKGCKINNGENSEEYCRILNEDIAKLQELIKEHTNTYPIVFAYPFGYQCKESIPVMRENGFAITLNCYEKPNYITRNPECLYDINRYNRSGLYSTEEFMSKLLKE